MCRLPVVSVLRGHGITRLVAIGHTLHQTRQRAGRDPVATPVFRNANPWSNFGLHRVGVKGVGGAEQQAGWRYGCLHVRLATVQHFRPVLYGFQTFQGEHPVVCVSRFQARGVVEEQQSDLRMSQARSRPAAVPARSRTSRRRTPPRAPRPARHRPPARFRRSSSWTDTVCRSLPAAERNTPARTDKSAGSWSGSASSCICLSIRATKSPWRTRSARRKPATTKGCRAWWTKLWATRFATKGLQRDQEHAGDGGEQAG